MKRRIDSLIAKNGFKGYSDYVYAIKTDGKLFEEFVNYLTINVSEFWRNPEQWEVLEKYVIPELIKVSGNRLKIWSAACSTCLIYTSPSPRDVEESRKPASA